MGQVTESFERVWLEHVWAPMGRAGRLRRSSADRAAAERMPSLALDTVVALFTIAMEQQVEGGIARELERQAERKHP